MRTHDHEFGFARRHPQHGLQLQPLADADARGERAQVGQRVDGDGPDGDACARLVHERDAAAPHAAVRKARKPALHTRSSRFELALRARE